jgi:hypothetical protein
MRHIAGSDTHTPDTSCYVSWITQEGRTPLDLALANKQEEVAKLLRLHNAVQGRELKERVQKEWRDAGKVAVLDHVASGALCEDYTMVFGNFSTFQADVKLSAAKFYYELEIKHIRGAAQFGWATEGFTRSTDDNKDAIVAGLVGNRANLNGVYKTTGDLYNGKPLFCKLNDPDRWLLFTRKKMWTITSTESKVANDRGRGNACSVGYNDEHPSQVEKWKVWNGKEWEMDTPAKCTLRCAGVGGNAFSWGFDGVRVCKLCDGKRSAFGTAWQEGDVLGLACDMVSKTVSFSVNGSFEPPPGVAFDNITADWIAPTFSASRGTKAVANFGHLPFKHAPPDETYVPVQDAERRHKELQERMHKAWRDAGNVVVLDHVAFGALYEDYTMLFGDLNTFKADVKLAAGKFYYELDIKHIQGIAQFGWATEGFESSTRRTGKGVGDNAFSWAFDGVRVSKWGDGSSSAFGVEWKEGDVLGLACDMVNKTVSFSVNGSFEPPLGIAFEKIVADSIAPAFTAERGFKVVANFGHLSFKHAPPDESYVSVQVASVVSQQDLGGILPGSTQSEEEEEEEEEV